MSKQNKVLSCTGLTSNLSHLIAKLKLQRKIQLQPLFLSDLSIWSLSIWSKSKDEMNITRSFPVKGQQIFDTSAVSYFSQI